MALINCPECNREISDQAKFCPHCGYPLKNITPTAVKQTPKAKKSLKPAPIILAAVAFVLIVSVLLILYLSGIFADNSADIDHHQYALEAIGIVDKYLDGEISASDASDLMDALVERGEKLPEPDSLETWDVEFEVLFLSTDLSSLTYSPTDETHDEIVERRNKLAELIGEKTR